MTKTVTGELITIEDSAYDGFKGMTIYGKTVQNLWANPSKTESGVTVTANANGSLSVSGTSTDVSSNRTGAMYTMKPNTAYIFYVDKTICSGFQINVLMRNSDGNSLGNIVLFNSTTSIVFTTPANFAYFQCDTYVIGADYTFSGTYRIMLREATPEEIAKAASTPQTLPVYPDGGPDASDDELCIMPLDVSTLADSDFDDYWCPPGLSSIDEVEVVTTGKNLLNYNNTLIKSGYGAKDVDSDGVVTSVNPESDQRAWTYANSDWKLQLPAGDYKLVFSVLTASDNSGSGYRIYDLFGKKILEVDNSFDEVGMISSDFSISSSTSIGIIIKIHNARVKVGIFRADDYTGGWEQYVGSTNHIDLQSNSLRSLPDGTRDELQIDAEGNCTLVKRIHEQTVTGSQLSTNYPNSTGAFTVASDVLDYPQVGNAYWDTYGLARGDVLLPEDIAFDRSTPGFSGTNSAYPSHLYVTPPSSSYDGSRQWLNDNNLTFMYKLAAPQTIQLGKISLPKLRKKPLVNNIWANGTAEGTGFVLAPEIDYEYNPWSTYCDGFKAHGKHSYFDMGCCIAARDTGTPEKKSVTATVPYMSGFYDLSKLYGAIAFEARQLMYRFEFVEDTREELQRKKSQFLEWLSQVHDEEIADDDIPGRHFIGSLSEWEFEEGEEGQSGSLEVTFNCQPFLEADEDTTKTCNAGSNTVTVEGQAVNAYAKTNSGTATIRIGGVTQSVGTTEIRLSVQLQPGDNAVTVTGSPVVLRWKELTV